VATGELCHANAGHEPPFTRAPGGEPERLGLLGGPPLGTLDAFDYPTERRRFMPGEWLCIVTDGATEAVNREKQFFGTNRLRATLAGLPQEIEPGELVKRLRAEVERFAEGAEAADDLTLLVLRWEGPAK